MLNQNLKEIYERVSQDLEVNKKFPTSFKNIFSIALSGLTYTVMEQLKKSEALLPDKATGEDLDSWGDVYGVLRKGKSKAKVRITVNSSKPLNIGPRELVFLEKESQTNFVNKGSINLVTGETPFEAVAEKAGYRNLDKASLSLNTTNEHIDTEVSFESIFEGSEIEEDKSYRKRLLEMIKSVPQAGSVSDYISWMEKINFVKRAFVKVVPKGGGTVGITFLSNANSYSIPNASQVKEVEKELRRLCPGTVELVYFQPKTKKIKIRYDITDENTGKAIADEKKIRISINKKIEEYFEKKLVVAEFLGHDCEKVDSLIYRDKIVKILESFKGYTTSLKEPNKNIHLVEAEYARPEF